MTNLWSEIRREFSALNEYIYLNTASMGLLSKRALEAGERWLKERVIGSLKWINWYRESMELKDDIGRLIGAKLEEIALVQNTSTGLNYVALSIPWEEGDNIIINDMEFPANRNIWQVIAKSKKIKLKVARNKNGVIDTDQYKELIDKKTKAIALSWVQYSNGYVHNLEELSDLSEEKDFYLIVDGIQGVGALKLNLRKLNVSFLSCGGHKWLMGLPGSGFLYVNESILDELKMNIAGWLSAKEPFNFDKFDYEPATDAKRFEIGSPSFIGYLVLKESLKILNSTGIDKVERRNKDLTIELVEKLGKEKVASPLKEDEPYSSIISVKHKDARKVVEKLKEKNIIVAYRAGKIRISIHFYNNEEDIETLIQNLKKSYIH